MEYAIYGQIYIPELGKYKGSVGSCSRVLHVSFSCFHGLEVLLSIYYIVLGGLERKVGSAYQDFMDSMDELLRSVTTYLLT